MQTTEIKETTRDILKSNTAEGLLQEDILNMQNKILGKLFQIEVDEKPNVKVSDIVARGDVTNVLTIDGYDYSRRRLLVDGGEPDTNPMIKFSVSEIDSIMLPSYKNMIYVGYGHSLGISYIKELFKRTIENSIRTKKELIRLTNTIIHITGLLKVFTDYEDSELDFGIYLSKIISAITHSFKGIGNMNFKLEKQYAGSSSTKFSCYIGEFGSGADIITVMYDKEGIISLSRAEEISMFKDTEDVEVLVTLITTITILSALIFDIFIKDK